MTMSNIEKTQRLYSLFGERNIRGIVEMLPVKPFVREGALP